MGKTKQKKNLTEKVQRGKKKHDVKNNPFELKINRQKFQVLGRKSKHDQGLPGISRSKAIKKRTETLLVEYKQKDKVNSFIDRRFGEFNPNMTVEEKMTKRFMMERQRRLKKSDLYNLNKGEELTHYGRSLADGQGMTDFIENADDDDPDDRGLLSVHKIHKVKLHEHAYKMQAVQMLQEEEYHSRLGFCQQFKSKIHKSPGFLDKLTFSDEATLHINGEVNRHN
uniref:nucleolar protein 14-like n=1 Tax=Myxine glutinosa TaxID=7769 RepID=UPI0035901E40